MAGASTSTNTVGQYTLVDRHAVGGVAEVFRARDRSTGRLVAIKRMRPDLPFDPEVAAGFLREVQLVLLAQHPNLIRGLSRGSHHELDYVVMEFIDGKDLEQVSRRAREARVDVPPRFWLFVIRELLAGLHAAHELTDQGGELLGLVHRDVNPRNILIDFEGTVKLGDFGAAVATFQEPPPEEVVGSAGYMAPEQAGLHSIDRRSDIFSVGCILYELITGERAFDVEKKSDSQILRAHQRGEVRPVPPPVEEPIRLIIEIATSVDPEERYRDADAMRVAIDQLLFGVGAPSGQGEVTRFRSLLSRGMRQLFPDDWEAARERAS